MKEIKYYCDKCNNEIPIDKAERIVIKIGDGNETVIKDYDVCPACNAAYNRMRLDFFESKPVIKETKTSADESKAVKRTYKKATPKERADILKMYEDGITLEEIAKKYNRTTHGVKLIIVKSGRTDAMVVKENENCKQLDPKKKYDVGGVIALRKAKWSVAKIADEKGYTKEEVMQILQSYSEGANDNK